MFRKKSIDEWALDYWLLQCYAKLCFNIYYRKVEVVNRQFIPKNQPVILAPNHQNALMDAMILVCKTAFQVVFLARADIFKGKRLIRFLTYLNIMPVYRIRDGIENVRKNDEVFEKTSGVLQSRHNPLCVFPEGNHGDKRKLRPLVKGIFRIAFQAQEKYGVKPAVKIIPIGCDYSHYQNFRTTLFVNIGEPIEVSDFMEVYHQNPVLALNQIKDRFAIALSRQIIDIQTQEYYDLYLYLREVFNEEMCRKLGIPGKTLADKFRADKVMIESLNKELDDNPNNISKLNTIMQEYQAGLKNERLRDWVVGRRKYAAVALIWRVLVKVFFLPVFAFGLVNNLLPYWLTERSAKKIKDTQFKSSFKYVTGMVFFPLWYLIILGVLIVTPLAWWLVISYFVFLPVTGLFAFQYFIGMKKLLAVLRFWYKRHTKQIKDLLQLRKVIIDHTLELINRHQFSS